MPSMPSRILPLRPRRVSPECGALLDALAAHCPAPWTLVAAACRRAGLNAASLTPEGVATVAQPLALAVARESGPRAGLAAHRALGRLVRSLRESARECDGAVRRPTRARSA